MHPTNFLMDFGILSTFSNVVSLNVFALTIIMSLHLIILTQNISFKKRSLNIVFKAKSTLNTITVFSRLEFIFNITNVWSWCLVCFGFQCIDPGVSSVWCGVTPQYKSPLPTILSLGVHIVLKGHKTKNSELGHLVIC